MNIPSGTLLVFVLDAHATLCPSNPLDLLPPTRPGVVAGGQLLPSDLVPEVAHFDAWSALPYVVQSSPPATVPSSSIITSSNGTGAAAGAQGDGITGGSGGIVTAWLDTQQPLTHKLDFRGGCAYDTSPYGGYGSIVLDGWSCYGRMFAPLPSWSDSPFAAWTFVMVWRLQQPQQQRAGTGPDGTAAPPAAEGDGEGGNGGGGSAVQRQYRWMTVSRTATSVDRELMWSPNGQVCVVSGMWG